MLAEMSVREAYWIDTIQTVRIRCTIRGATSCRRHTRGARPLEARVLFIGMHFLTGFIICGCHGFFFLLVTFSMVGTQTTYKKENGKIDNARLFGCDPEASVKTSVNATLLTTIKNCSIAYVVIYLLLNYGAGLLVQDTFVLRTRKTKKKQRIVTFILNWQPLSKSLVSIESYLTVILDCFFLFRLDDMWKRTYICMCMCVYVAVKI